jgi:hypothetical protein
MLGATKKLSNIRPKNERVIQAELNSFRPLKENEKRDVLGKIKAFLLKIRILTFFTVLVIF